MSILPPWERRTRELLDAAPTTDDRQAPADVTAERAADQSLDLGTVAAHDSSVPGAAAPEAAVTHEPAAAHQPAATVPPPGTGGQRAQQTLAVQPISSTGRFSLARRWDALPLRARLVTILLVALLAALAATGYGVQAVLRGFLINQIDNQLRDTYRQAQSNPRFLQTLIAGRSPGGPTPYATRIFVPGSPDLASTSLPSSAVAPPQWADPATLAQAQAVSGQPTSLVGTDGNGWRAIMIIFPAATGAGIDVQATATMALPTRSVEESVERLRLLTLLIGGAVLVLCTLLGWLAIRRSFAPLVEVETTAAAIAAGDLSQRVPERPVTTEVGRLTRSLNLMLAKIEDAFRAREASESRTRRFAADASHELRTPLASIRGFAELYRQGAVPQDEVPRTMRRIEDEAKRMGGLVEDLLLLARLDERRAGRAEPVDLAVLADDAVHDARGLDPERVVRLVGLDDGTGPDTTDPADPTGSAVVVGDEDRLRQVVANLVSNAVRHTPPGTPIEVAVGTRDGHAVLEVRDHGLGLTQEQAERVFERFYRVDSSRHRGQGGGSGLGLSIVAAVVAAHEGQVGVQATPGGGATFIVRLPAGPEGPPSPR